MTNTEALAPAARVALAFSDAFPSTVSLSALADRAALEAAGTVFSDGVPEGLARPVLAERRVLRFLAASERVDGATVVSALGGAVRGAALPLASAIEARWVRRVGAVVGLTPLGASVLDLPA